MPIPDYQQLLLPTLRIAAKETISINDAVARLGAELRLSEEELSVTVTSGNKSLFKNKVEWAASYLRGAGLIERPQRAHITATNQGLSLLKENLTSIDKKFLSDNYPVFKQFLNGKKKSKANENGTTKNLKENATQIAKNSIGIDIDDSDNLDAQEGRLLVVENHRYRERDPKIVSNKKAAALKKAGRLQCEGCGFDFMQAYGTRGEGFIECHHIKPLSKIKEGEKTKLEDLALVCSNCHRMIHRHAPWLSMGELKAIASK